MFKYNFCWQKQTWKGENLFFYMQKNIKRREQIFLYGGKQNVKHINAFKMLFQRFLCFKILSSSSLTNDQNNYKWDNVCLQIVKSGTN